MNEQPKTFAVGDIVRLHSGGPVMTVSALHPEKDEVTCLYFDRNGMMLFNPVPYDCLLHAEEDENYQAEMNFHKLKTQFDTLQLETAIQQGSLQKMNLKRGQKIHGHA